MGKLLLMVALLPLIAQAQVYRWVDDNGKVHYGDRPLGTENTRMRGLIDPTAAAAALPKPGMKADELRSVYGEPERIRKVSTKSGETEVWVYSKGKRAKRDFMVKIEGGEVIEVLTDTALDAARPMAGANAQEAARATAAAEYQYQQAIAQQELEQKESRCTRLRENYQRIESQERRGGSDAVMDSLRDQKRQYSEQLSAQGC